MGMTYGYVRVSTPKQHPERQHRNIKAAYPEAVMVEDIYTGTDLSRPNWNRLLARLNPGDTIVFDSVSRLSRDATEGYSIYADLFNRGINLIFLKEPHINTDTYRSALKNSIELTGTPVDLILDGINAYLLALANQQIRLAFEASEKEVADLRQRTREGIQTARIAGKQIGRKKGVSVETKKEREAKEIIKKHSTEFGGSLSDKEVIALAKISRNTYYKYKRELKGQLAGQILLF